MRNPTARAEARAKGEKQYFTGIPCKQGHIAPRATLTGTCVECTAVASKNWAANNKDKAREYTAKYRAQNAELIRERDRLAHIEARKKDPERFKALAKNRYVKKVQAEGREHRPFNRLAIAELVARLQEVHAGKLQYVDGYTTMTDNAAFLCTIHNKEVQAHPHNVLRGAIPCPSCNHTRSEGENQIAKYFSMFTEVQQRNRQLLRPREIDVFMPVAKLAVEYCGEYWHSHGSSEEERKNKHKHYQKYVGCKDAGIRLLTVYEQEWLERGPALRRLFRNALGKGKGKLMARKCSLGTPTHQEAKEFYDRYHPQGGEGSGEHFGLYWKGKLVACMRFTFGVNDRGVGAKTRVWTLSRYATRITVAGAASRLFKAFLTEHSPQEVKSFSDNRYFDGGMYEKLGFTLEEETAPDYQVWSPKLGLRPKSHYQRRNLAARLKEHGVDAAFDAETDPRTEAEVTYSMGCRRLYDCGKKRWVWRACAQTQSVL